MLPFANVLLRCGGLSMYIPVILTGGHEDLVSKDELQFLMFTNQVISFKRADGWAVPGRDKMRGQIKPYRGKERRQHDVFSLDY